MNDYSIPVVPLNRLLTSWRTGWRIMPGTHTWLRISPGQGGEDDPRNVICELIPFASELPNGVGPHYNWWGDGDGWRPTPGSIELVESFYVFRDLEPIDQYVSFRLKSKDGSLVPGSVVYGWKNHHHPPYIREPKPLKLRFKILSRDGFRCQYCGRTPMQTELQIDHIVPISRGGRTTRNNLITSCRQCNLGKGDVLLRTEPVGPPAEPELLLPA